MLSASQSTISPAGNLIKTIIHSKQPLMMVFKYLLVVSIVIIGISGVWFSSAALDGYTIYQKDFRQDYAMTRAVIAGVNPYLTHAKLSRIFDIYIYGWTIPHPTPHPPAVAVYTLPLGLLTYPQAALAWYLFELLCVLISAWLIIKSLKVKLNILMNILVVAITALAMMM